MTHILDIAAAQAAKYLETLDSRPIAARASLEELRGRLAKPMPETAIPSAVLRRRPNHPLTAATMGTYPQATPRPTPML